MVVIRSEKQIRRPPRYATRRKEIPAPPKEGGVGHPGFVPTLSPKDGDKGGAPKTPRCNSGGQFGFVTVYN
jgi:hypothetical protein